MSDENERKQQQSPSIVSFKSSGKGSGRSFGKLSDIQSPDYVNKISGLDTPFRRREALKNKIRQFPTFSEQLLLNCVNFHKQIFIPLNSIY